METTNLDLLRPRQVAEILGITEGALWSWIAQGYFPKPIKLAPRVAVYRPATVEAFIAQREAGSAV
ncbi:helix-turn-helix transcriptional regulator [Caballeronia sp. LZ035]|uniref:helix-turn-helix transcriptional regulator n=1 Tax=Caballeronia sp. LZ035 TaxID=3038568 RepID=UPI0038D381FB